MLTEIVTDKERDQSQEIIRDLYSYTASQSCIIEKCLAYMDEIRVDCMLLRRKSPLILDENNPMIKMEKLSKNKGLDQENPNCPTPTT